MKRRRTMILVAFFLVGPARLVDAAPARRGAFAADHYWGEDGDSWSGVSFAEEDLAFGTKVRKNL